jgi:oxygen-dependent protoporphyrinogen oxidase
MSAFDVIIVGGGISGLSALHFLKNQKPDLRTKLFEADQRVGGTIGTDHVDGFSLDWGPNGFLDREPLTLQLCRELDLSEQLEQANDNVTNRFILRNGKLRPVPMSPPKFLTSDILSVRGRLRVLLEPFAPGPNGNQDESIYDFARRRIGQEAANYLVQPMVSGVYGGLADQLSLESCFPIMKTMETKYGSLVKAMIARKKQSKASDRGRGGPAGPGGWLTSFRGGLNRIIERFEERYADHIVTGNGAVSIDRVNGKYNVALQDGSTVVSNHVVIAAPAYKASELTRELSSSLTEALKAIPYAPISVVCLGYLAEKVKRDLDGFGFLVPQKEHRRVLGSIWTSSIFEARAPQGYVQFRTMVGGDGDHDSARLSEKQLVDLVKSDLADIMVIKGEPTFHKVYRWTHGIPQYRIGHRKLMETMARALDSLPGVHITGNAYYGIGLNDCVRLSHQVAGQVIRESS